MVRGEPTSSKYFGPNQLDGWNVETKVHEAELNNWILISCAFHYYRVNDIQIHFSSKTIPDLDTTPYPYKYSKTIRPEREYSRLFELYRIH